VATLELRPRSATEIVDASFQLLRANFLPLVTLSVAVQLPVLIIRIWAVRLGLNSAGAADQILGMIVPIMVFGVLLVLFALVVQCAMTVAASQVYLGVTVDAGSAIRRGLQRFVPMIATYLLVGIGFVAAGIVTAILPSSARAIAMIVLVIIGIFVALRLIPLNTVVVLEDASPVDAIKRALFLGDGLVGHMFLASLLGGLVYAGIAIVAALVVALLGAIVPAVKDPNVEAVFQTAAGALVYPLIIAIAVVLYYDLRIRREGFDVEMMSRATPR
jgi:hypothetical protein